MLSIIIIYYNTGNKTGYLNEVLKSLERQTNKNFEIIIIDNHSPVPIVKDTNIFFDYRGFLHEPRIISLYAIPGGLVSTRGQCTARNIGTKLANGARVTWNDGDCVVSRNFVEVHLATHADVLNVAYDGGRMPGTLTCDDTKEALKRVSWLEEHPRDLSIFLQHPEPAHFLNCITRGVSVKTSIARYMLFDEDFNYNGADPNSGKGWEDIDFGIRLYKAESIIEGNLSAFTVHINHSMSAPDMNHARAAYKNWLLLHRKHPELKSLVPGWCRDTLNAIMQGQSHEELSGK